MFLKLEFKENQATSGELSTTTRVLLAIAIVALGTSLIYAILSAGKAPPDLAAQVAEKLDLSGVGNPVTAVLLNFRSYDTLLEVAVLLVVAVAIMPPRLSSSAGKRFLFVNDTHNPHVPDPILLNLLKWLVPLAILLGGYLLWTGAYSPGGAFQAAAVIAGAGVALSLGGRHKFAWEISGVRLASSLGLLVFVTVAATNAFITGTTLQYPIDHASTLILLVETFTTVSIATILLLLFAQLKSLADPPGEMHQ